MYYNPDHTTLLVGSVAVSGVADGTGFVISRANAENMIPVAGINGDVALAHNKDRLGTLTLHLLNTSSTNATLNAWQALVDIDSVDNPFFTVQLTQADSAMGIDTYGWIQSQPDWTLGQDVNHVEWVIGLADATLVNVDATVTETISAATTS